MGLTYRTPPRALSHREVRHPEAARQGRDRHRLSREGHVLRQGSRAQDHRARGVPRPRVRHRLPLAVPERGLARRQAAPSAHRRHPRRGGEGGLGPHRDGGGHRRRPVAAREPRHAAAGRRRAADRLQVLRRARLRVRGGHRAPRHQAGEHHDAGTRREDRRLRRRAAARSNTTQVAGVGE